MATFKLKRNFTRVGSKGKGGVASTLTYLTGVAKTIVGTVGSKAKSGVLAVLDYVLLSVNWNVPPISLTQGNTSNIASTGPSGYTAGGVYDVDASGSALPAGFTLSSAGVLTNVSGAAATTNNIVFGYTEPNALPVLTLNPTKTGTFPYQATVYPPEGVLKTGRFLVSPDDPNLRSSTINTWPDGSARVVVVASSGIAVTNGVTKAINLRVNTTEVAGVALTTARFAQVLTDVRINFSGTEQTLTLNGANPDWVWWANSQVICARFRLLAGLGVVEAIIDVHAFASNFALVEIVIENGKLNTAVASVTSFPSPAVYSNGTVKVNNTLVHTVTPPPRGTGVPDYNRRRNGNTYPPAGTEVAVVSILDSDVSGPAANVGDKYALSANAGANAGKIATWTGTTWTYQGPLVGQVVQRPGYVYPHTWIGAYWAQGWVGGHEFGRAVWCPAWVASGTATAEGGASDPGIEVTHDTAWMQAHPFFYKQAVNPTENFAAQQRHMAPWDQYVKWGSGWLRTASNNDGADDDELGQYSRIQADYLLTGSKLARRSVIATGLSVLTYQLCMRDSTTNQPSLPISQMGSKRQNGSHTWPFHVSAPAWGGTPEERYHDTSHTPAIALVPFLCRPAPVFIEMAQYHAAWWQANSGGTSYEQVRGRGWGTRNVGFAVLLTPDNITVNGSPVSQESRKNEYRQCLMAACTQIDNYHNWSWNPLGAMPGNFSGTTCEQSDESSDGGNNTEGGQIQINFYFQHILGLCMHLTDVSKALLTTDAATWKTVADKVLSVVVRRVVESTGTEWRALGYHEYIGIMRNWNNSTTRYVEENPNWGATIKAGLTGTPPTAPGLPLFQGTGTRDWSIMGPYPTGSQGQYPDWWWNCLCVCAERDQTNAAAAWVRVVGGTFGTGELQPLQTWINGYATHNHCNRWPRNK